MRTIQSEQLFERAKKTAPGGVHSPVRAFRGVGGVPRFIKSAAGSQLEDVDGNRYIDFCMSWGPLIFGHQDPETREAVQGALLRGWSFGTAEPYSLELAEFVTANIPWVEKVRFVSSGTEAVMSALRLAKAATGRNRIVKFDGCYHGHVDGMLVRSGSGLADMASPDSAGVSQLVASETLVVPLNDLAALQKVFETVGREVAAVIVEPIPANFGLLMPQDDFLRALMDIAHAHGSLVIFDEVITGFRTAFGGMAEKTGLRPDLVTYGKIMGGGFPAAAYGGRADLMEWVAPQGSVYQAGTLSANPVAMVAGLTTLKRLKRDQPYELLEERVKWIGEKLEGLAHEFDFPIRVQKFASLFWPIFGRIESADGFVRTPSQIPADHRSVYSNLFHRLLQKGFYFAPSAFEVSFLSTAHSHSDLENLVEAVRECMTEMRDHPHL